MKPHPGPSFDCEPSQTHSLEGGPDDLLSRPQPLEARQLEPADDRFRFLAREAAEGLRVLGAVALEQVQEDLSQTAKKLTQGTFFAVPKAQLTL